MYFERNRLYLFYLIRVLVSYGPLFFSLTFSSSIVGFLSTSEVETFFCQEGVPSFKIFYVVSEFFDVNFYE